MRSDTRRRAAVLLAATVLMPACVGVGVSTIEQFEAAVEGGATCAELYDQRSGFDNTDLARIDDLLHTIGCDGPESERNDR